MTRTSSSQRRTTCADAVTYGNGVTMTAGGFNARLQATEFEVKKDSALMIKKEYEYYADGSLRFSRDLRDQMFDRLYRYDHLGRTTEARSGAEARARSDYPNFIPYRQQMTYNGFGEMTGLAQNHFVATHTSFPSVFTDGRRSGSAYDAEGNETADEGGEYAFDAAGRMVRNRETDDAANLPALMFHDGAGAEVKRIRFYDPAANNVPLTNYYLRSSVTGRVLTEANGTGAKLKTFVPADGTVLAEQQAGLNNFQQVSFIHQDPSGASLMMTSAAGGPLEPWPGYRAAEHNALGSNVGAANPYLATGQPPPDDSPGPSSVGFNDIDFSGKFLVDGLPVPQSFFLRRVESAGGALGLLEMAHNLNRREIGRWYRTVTRYQNGTAGGVRVSDENGIFGPAESWSDGDFRIISQDTFLLSVVYASDWGVNFSITSFLQRETQNINVENQSDDGLDYANKYYLKFYDDCNGSKYIERKQAAMVLTAAGFDSARSAQVAAFWMWETSFEIFPSGDAGPAQLTSWWKRNYPELIVGNSYGSWNGRTEKPFDGDPLANLMTLANITGFSLKRYAGSFYQTAYWYGPGSKEHPRDTYAQRIVNNLEYLRPFFDCITAKGKN